MMVKRLTKVKKRVKLLRRVRVTKSRKLTRIAEMHRSTFSSMRSCVFQSLPLSNSTSFIHFQQHSTNLLSAIQRRQRSFSSSSSLWCPLCNPKPPRQSQRSAQQLLLLPVQHGVSSRSSNHHPFAISMTLPSPLLPYEVRPRWLLYVSVLFDLHLLPSPPPPAIQILLLQ